LRKLLLTLTRSDNTTWRARAIDAAGPEINGPFTRMRTSWFHFFRYHFLFRVVLLLNSNTIKIAFIDKDASHSVFSKMLDNEGRPSKLDRPWELLSCDTRVKQRDETAKILAEETAVHAKWGRLKKKPLASNVCVFDCRSIVG
jgi:hypothetical protein